MASSPVAARATTFMSGSRSMMSAMPSRTMRWSSTQRTRMGARACSAREGLLCMRRNRLDERATARLAFHPEAAACGFGAFLHARQTVVPVAARFRDIEADAIVAHAQHDLAVGVRELHADVAGPRVPDRVRDGLAADAQELRVDIRVRLVRSPRKVERERRLCRRGGMLADLAQRCAETVRFETRRSKIPDRLARFADVVFDVVPHPHELILEVRRRQGEIPRHRVALQRHPKETLKERVVNFPAQPRAFTNE